MPTSLNPILSIFAPLGKVSEQTDGTVLVDFTASTEAVDDQGEIVEYEAVKKASADYMTWAALREMHQPSAIGTTVALETDDELKKVTGVAHVVDPVAVQKVLSGVYKGVSIGGQKLARVMSKVGGKAVPRITDIRWIELSLVDRPSNPEAVMTLAKRSTEGDQPETAGDQAVDAAAHLESASDPAQQPDGAAAETPADAGEASPAGATPEAAAGVVEGSNPTDATPDEPTLERAAATGDLAKSAVDDVMDANYIANSLAILIEEQAMDGDSEDAVALRKALKIVQGWATVKAADVGNAADVAERVEEIAATPIPVVIVDPFYYSAVTGDLAKRAVALAKLGGSADPTPELDTLITLAKAAGGRCDHDITPASETAVTPSDEVLAKVADAALERASDQLMAKVTQAIGPLVRPDELEAMQATVLGLLEPMKETLAKIAAQPAPGGPARYAQDARRFGPDGETGISPEITAEVLSKVAAAATDPAQKEALGLAAATAQIRADQAR